MNYTGHLNGIRTLKCNARILSDKLVDNELMLHFCTFKKDRERDRVRELERYMEKEKKRD